MCWCRGSVVEIASSGLRPESWSFLVVCGLIRLPGEAQNLGSFGGDPRCESLEETISRIAYQILGCDGQTAEPVTRPTVSGEYESTEEMRGCLTLSSAGTQPQAATISTRPMRHVAASRRQRITESPANLVPHRSGLRLKLSATERSLPAPNHMRADYPPPSAQPSPASPADTSAA